MAGPYTTTAEIKTRLAGMLKKTTTDLATWWDTFISDGIDWAYGQIVTELANRGYTIAQIDVWILRKSFERDMALWHALVNGAGMDQYDTQILDRLDRREELKLVSVISETTSLTLDPLNPQTFGFGYMDDDRSVFKRQVDSSGELDQTKW